MTGTTEPQASPDPFTAEFDYDENHCTWGVDGALEDLDPATAQLILGKAGDKSDDDDTVHDLLEEHAKELRDRAQNAVGAEYARLDKLIDQVETAASRLDYCTGGCDCAWDALGTWKEFVEELLETLGDRSWAVSEEAWREPKPLPQHDCSGTLGYGELERYASVDEWSSMTVTWNGTTLVLKIQGRHGNPEVAFTPVDAATDALAERWSTIDGYNDCRRGMLLNEDADAVATTLDLWDVLDRECDSFTLDLEDTIAAFTKLPPADRRQVDFRVVAGLVDEGRFTGTADELLTCVLAATAA